jgi:hypothetical protein
MIAEPEQLTAIIGEQLSSVEFEWITSNSILRART